MENFLQQVLDERRQDAAAAAAQVSFGDLQRHVATLAVRRSLVDRLHNVPPGGACIIAEIKRASPSAGVLRAECDPAQIAMTYERAGAAGVSVVTEPRHFHGVESDVTLARDAVSLPVLRKDFFCDPYQIYQSAALGADVVLLIAACLDFSMLRDLYIIALAIGMEVVVEVHTADELEMVLPLANVIIGVNSRDLMTMKTDLNVTRELGRMIPADRVAIAESGIRTRRDVLELRELGYRGFLIGEALMRSANPALLLRMLQGLPPRAVP